jgi:hypothetical protein
MASETKTVEIGFFGGATSARLSEDEVGKLRRAVEKGEWVDLQSADGPLSLNGANVIFLRIDEHAAQIGFRT